jgi:phage/conjugal plasmid C-4 type zinc finger TraR family protein
MKAGLKLGIDKMATGWAGDGAVQDQIDATVKDGIKRAQSRLPHGPGLSHCAKCGNDIPVARRNAIRGVRLCLSCQEAHDREAGEFVGYNRRGSKDSQLR